jgi:DNA polymerase (family 10)
MLHRHSDLSAGTETLETMAEATRGRGFQYFGVADQIGIAGGLSTDEIKQQDQTPINWARISGQEPKRRRVRHSRLRTIPMRVWRFVVANILGHPRPTAKYCDAPAKISKSRFCERAMGRIAVEINGHLWRLDHDCRWHQAALDFGCMVSIRTRTRCANSLMHWGLEMARTECQQRGSRMP